MNRDWLYVISLRILEAAFLILATLSIKDHDVTSLTVYVMFGIWIEIQIALTLKRIDRDAD